MSNQEPPISYSQSLEVDKKEDSTLDRLVYFMVLTRQLGFSDFLERSYNYALALIAEQAPVNPLATYSGQMLETMELIAQALPKANVFGRDLVSQEEIDTTLQYFAKIKGHLKS